MSALQGTHDDVRNSEESCTPSFAFVRGCLSGNVPAYTTPQAKRSVRRSCTYIHVGLSKPFEPPGVIVSVLGDESVRPLAIFVYYVEYNPPANLAFGLSSAEAEAFHAGARTQDHLENEAAVPRLVHPTKASCMQHIISVPESRKCSNVAPKNMIPPSSPSAAENEHEQLQRAAALIAHWRRAGE